MKLLVTAGNTQAPMDRVRCVTNIFTGRTGGQIAARAYDRGHHVTLLTSHPEVVEAYPAQRSRVQPDWQLVPYRTFRELHDFMEIEVLHGHYDALIHSAAVSDYLTAGIYANGPGGLTDVAADKVRSTHSELWIKMTPAPKLVDLVRREWRFEGVLVKFKLEVGATDVELLDIAEQSRSQSKADLMCANTLEGMNDWAYLGSRLNCYQRLRRVDLTEGLLDAVEKLHQSKKSPLVELQL